MTYIIKQYNKACNWVEYFQIDVEKETAYPIKAVNCWLATRHNYWNSIMDRYIRNYHECVDPDVACDILTQDELFIDLL